MNKKITTLISIIIFICLIIGASFLYNKLSQGELPEQIQNFDSSEVTETDEQAEIKENAGQETLPQENSSHDDTDEDTSSQTNTSTEPENQEQENTNHAASAESNNNSAKQNAAPDFTVYDIDGNAVKLSDFVGKPTVLNFWASWCGPCKSEMPHFDEAYKEIGNEINFIMVNLTDGDRETVEKASSYIKSQNYSLPMYYDTNTNAANIYQVYSIPTTYFIDASGNLVAQATGAIDKGTLFKGINMIR